MMDDKEVQRALLQVHYQGLVIKYMSDDTILKHTDAQAALINKIFPYLTSMQKRLTLLQPETQLEFLQTYKLSSTLELSFYIALAYELYRQQGEAGLSDAF